MTRGTAALVSAFALTFAACSDDPTTPPPVNNGTKPVIKTFRANPSAVARGATTVLEYEVTGATSVAFSTSAGQFATPAELMGSVTTPAISADTTFTLTASGEGGTTTQNVVVTIDASAVDILSFTATPNPVEEGGTVNLSWQTAGAKSIRLLRDGQEILAAEGARATMSTETADIERGPVVFRLEASNDAGMTDSMDVTVTTASPVEITNFAVSPQVFTGASAMVSVTWTTVNATGLTLTANDVAVPGFMTGVATGTITVNVTEATRFVLTAQGLGGPLTATQLVSRAVGEVEPNDTPMTATPLNGGGAQGSLTADDVDHYSIVVPANGNLTIQTTDGMGGCPFDTLVTLLGPDGMPVTDDDDSGDGLCSLIDPRADVAAADLPAGTYTIVVEGYMGATGDYALIVQVGTAACGNSIIEASLTEQCDDGNVATGDGCDAMCDFEIRGTVMTGGDMTFTGSLPLNGTAAYTLTLTEANYVAIDTFAPTADTCPDADLVTGIFDAAGAFIGSDDNDGINSCAAISPALDDFALLEPGTYTILLISADGSALPSYAIRIRSFGEGCGNGVPEMGEACDDGNTTAGDGCNGMCVVEVEGTVTGGPAEQTFSGSITPGRSYNYAIVVTTPVYFYAETGVPTIGTCAEMDSDTILTLTSSTGATVLSDDDTEDSVCSRIDPTESASPILLRPATYNLRVSGYQNMETIAAFQVLIGLSAPACGDGILNGTEQCDDGNTTADNNGCTAACMLDMSILQESEPNDTNATADAFPATVRTATVVATGGIGNGGADVDVYSFEVTGQPANLTVRTYSRLGDSSACGNDTILRLTNAAGAVIAVNDDAEFGFVCSEISTTVTGTAASTLAPGRYYLSVTEFDADNEIPRYFLDLRLR